MLARYNYVQVQMNKILLMYFFGLVGNSFKKFELVLFEVNVRKWTREKQKQIAGFESFEMFLDLDLFLIDKQIFVI